MLKSRKVLVEHVKSSNLLISSFLIFDRNSISWYFRRQIFRKRNIQQNFSLKLTENFPTEISYYKTMLDLVCRISSNLKFVILMKFLDSREIKIWWNLTKFKRNLSEFFLNFKPQKFNLCDCMSKKVRISYIFFRILTKFSWNLWISLKLDQF